MLQYDRTDVSKGIDVNKTDDSHDCIICHYWYFLDINFKFDPKVCNVCHDLIEKSMSFNDVAIVYVVKENDYRIHFWSMSKNKAVNLFKNADLTEKSWTL